MDVLLNWLTQGVIVAIVTAAVLPAIPRSRAQARYGVVWTAYLLVLVLPIVPAVLAMALGGPTLDLGPAAGGPVVTMPAAWWTSPLAAIGLWIVWSCVQTVRLALSAISVRHARRRGHYCPEDVLARLPHWARVRVTGRRTRVMLSSDVRAAAVLGCGTPVIAISPRLIEQLSVADLDRVLVHEWAHVQRRDDLAQLAQRIVHFVIGWHPAAWWLQQQVEFEREAACDEIAVGVTGSAKGYATCLARLATLPEERLRSVAALAAASPSRLRGRILRILASPCAAAARPWRAITLAAGGGLLACTVVIGNLQLVASTVTSAVASQTAGYPLRPASIVRDLAVASRSAARTEPASSSMASRRRASRGTQRPAAPEPSPRVDATAAVGQPLTSVVAVTPLPAARSPLDASGSLPTAIDPTELPVKGATETPAPAYADSPELRATDQPRAPWTRAADVGIDIGRGSQAAGIATAGFFRRFGKRLAGAF